MINNIDKIRAMLDGPDGARILRDIMKDGGGSLENAARGIKSGDLSAAHEIYNSIMNTPGGAELAAKIARAAKGQ
ncbi:MAG: hypothetical protein RSC43_02360 [Clostridia bacterium]